MLMNSLSVMDKNTDTNKQLAYMRNYINQLKDEIESELSNISYDNLDADLRQRFDDMEKGLLTANNTTLEVAGVLKTQYLKADEIAAKYITAQTVAATYATITSLNAVDGKFNNLNADNITSGTVDTQRLDVNYIASTALKTKSLHVNNLYTHDQIIMQGTAAITGVRAQFLNVYATTFGRVNDAKNIAWTTINIDGTNYTVLTGS